MSNMVPLNFVRGIFTSWGFMAERIKVIMKIVAKIQRARGLNCVNRSAWERRKQRGMNRGRERKKEGIMTRREAAFQHHAW